MVQTELINQLSRSIFAYCVIKESLRCKKAAHDCTKKTLDKQWNICKQLSVLIATSFTSPTFLTFPTYCVDLKEKKDMIQRLEKVIYKNRKNQKMLELRLTEMSKRLTEKSENLQQKNDHISNLKKKLYSF